MKLNTSYKIIVDVDGRILTFTGKLISFDDDFITFIDKFETTLTYNKSKIISMEELQ